VIGPVLAGAGFDVATASPAWIAAAAAALAAAAVAVSAALRSAGPDARLARG
jgi:hypothetical protein